jgi:hypothetical protein
MSDLVFTLFATLSESDDRQQREIRLMDIVRHGFASWSQGRRERVESISVTRQLLYGPKAGVSGHNSIAMLVSYGASQVSGRYICVALSGGLEYGCLSEILGHMMRIFRRMGN